MQRLLKIIENHKSSPESYSKSKKPLPKKKIKIPLLLLLGPTWPLLSKCQWQFADIMIHDVKMSMYCSAVRNANNILNLSNLNGIMSIFARNVIS